MKTYILRRLLWILPILLGITLISFFCLRLAPGGPVQTSLALDPRISPEARQRFIKLYGLDQPLPIQYIHWLGRVVRFDFGQSFKDDRPVVQKILERLPATLLLNILTLAFIFLIGIPIGLASARHPGGFLDRGLTLFVFVGFSLPTFWVAILLMLVFGIKLGWLPISGLHSLSPEAYSELEWLWDTAKHLVLPVLASSLTGLAGISRYMRHQMLEVLQQDYIRLARAKGLPERVVFLKHAFRNALLPIVTLAGLALPDLIGGGFIFETIFAYPGMGRLGYEAVMARDYPVIMGVGTIAAILTLLGNLLSDISYAWVDPRIRYGKQASS